MKSIDSKRTLIAPFLLAAEILAVAVNAAAAQELSGKGEWQSLNGVMRGTWTVALTQTGDRVDGQLTLSGSNVLSGGAVSGDISASRIMLGVLSDGTKQASFAGQLDGTSVKGEWEFPALKDNGVWFGDLSEVSNETGTSR